jgi:predicted TIM-barrel fold metal-dependent hydrolase
MIDSDVVDCHHHLWDLRNAYPWLQEQAGRLEVHGDDSGIRHDYLVEDLRTDAADVPLVKSVHVDAGAADGWAESQWLQGIADEHGFPHAIVAGARLGAPTVGEDLDRLSSLANVRGVREILNWHPDPGFSYVERPDLIDDGRWRAGFGRLEAHGLSFDLQLYPHQLADAARLAADHPSTRILLNHAGMPLDRSADGLELWRAGLHALAAQDNTLVKISGIGMTDHAWTLESAAPIVLECIETFGPDRSMFGSNFPVDSIYSSYRDLYAAYDEITGGFSVDERAWMFGGTATFAYRL